MCLFAQFAPRKMCTFAQFDVQPVYKLYTICVPHVYHMCTSTVSPLYFHCTSSELLCSQQHFYENQVHGLSSVGVCLMRRPSGPGKPSVEHTKT